MILDAFFAEGVVCYFRVCMVLFKFMEKSLLRINCMGEFLKFIESYITHEIDIKAFKDELRAFYINKNLVNHLRGSLVESETGKYHRSCSQWRLSRQRSQ